MAKKTKAGGKIKSAAKPRKTQDSTSTEENRNSGNKYNSSFSDHKKNDGKFQPQRIEKKRG